jgi:cyclase
MTKRIIPTLLLHKGGLYKTVKFSNPKYLGDPINIMRIFNDKKVDEIVVLDIDASRNRVSPNFKVIEQIASEAFMPLSYGGGISTLEQASQIFKSGVEKVVLNSVALVNPMIIKEMSDRFGSQSVVVSVDVKKNIFGKYKVYDWVKKQIGGENLSNYLNSITNYGVGEIIINSVDKDGTLSGPDLELLKQVSKMVSVPLVYQGGISNEEDIKKCFVNGADAVAAGSFFVFHGIHKAVLISYPEKRF